MKYLNVVDLDKTLITVDSFRELILKKIDFILLVLIFLRACKLITRYSFARGAARRLNKVLSDRQAMEEFAGRLLKKVNNNVLEKVRQHSIADTVTVVLSASPEEYVKEFAQQLGFAAMGSHWQGKNYFHCYGQSKVDYLRQKYPKESYVYNFAISDNKGDLDLLKLFKTSILYGR